MNAAELREHARVLREMESRHTLLGRAGKTPQDLSHGQQARDCQFAADLLDRETYSLETQHTHPPDCWSFGPAHYECAKRRAAAFNELMALARQEANLNAESGLHEQLDAIQARVKGKQ